MSEKSGIEKFFDVGGQRQIDEDDPLSWEKISQRQVGVDGNELIERNPGGSNGYSTGVGVTGNTRTTGRIDCLRAEDCGSGFVCVQGECVLNSTAGGSQGGGLTTTECGTTPPIPDLPSGNWVNPCGEQGAPCIETTGPGGCLELPDIELNCCGQQKYRCCFEGKCNDQCFPCFELDLDFPPIAMPGFPPIDFPDFDDPLPPIIPPGTPWPIPNTCSPFGDANGSNFGPGDGGESGIPTDSCQSECAVCVNGTCEEKPKGAAPCFCHPDSCGECRSCQDNGSCGEPAPGQCRTYCNCSVWCDDCNKRIHGRFSVAYPPVSGALACPAACREALKEKCPSCPPPKNPCWPDPADPCEAQCWCIHVVTPCGDPPPCPPGSKCTVLGTLYAEPCLFEKHWIIKECNPPWIGCGESCKTRGCGACQTCNHSTGECESIPDCGDPSKECPGQVCGDGTCCGAPGQGGVCVPTRQFTCTDTCHGGSSTFSVPAGAYPQLSHIGTVSAKDAICDRYHTHCNISVCGRNVGSHLDCGKGCSGGAVRATTTCSANCF